MYNEDQGSPTTVIDELPTFDPIDVAMRQWWCSACNERGPLYKAGDRSVYAGWVVHVGKHERSDAGSNG